MGIPCAASATVELDKANAMFDQAPREQPVAAEYCSSLLIETIKLFNRFGLFRKIDCLRSFGLHAESQFITANAGIQFAELGMSQGMLPIQFGEECQLAALLVLSNA